MPALVKGRRHFGGFTLVELMVAIAVTAFLLAGMMTLLQNTRRAATTQSASSRQQDNARLALTILTDTIQLAGYYPDVGWTGTLPAPLKTIAIQEFGIYSDPVAPAFFTTPAASSAQIVAGVGDWGAAAPGDSISIRYETTPNDGTLTCTGTSNTAGVNEFFVNTFFIDNVGNLSCTLTTLTAAGPSYNLVSRDTVIIVPAGNNGPAGTPPTGVQNLEFLYGVKTNAAATCNCADTYLSVTQMNASATAWLNVVSVMVRVTFANPVAGQPLLQFSRVISLMGQVGVTL